MDLLRENSLDSLPDCSPPPVDDDVVVAVDPTEARLTVDCCMLLLTFSTLWLGLDVLEALGEVISACWLEPRLMDHDFESLNLSLSERVLMNVERRPESEDWRPLTS